MPKLFPYLLLTASSLLAAEYTCCEPTCEHKIDCESYMPACYDPQCDWDVFVDGEFLYWFGRENLPPFAVEITGQPVDPNDPTNIFIFTPPTVCKHFDVKWKPGFRVGLGRKAPCDNWDFYANWTYYQNEKKDSFSVDPNLTFIFPDTPSSGNFALLNLWVDGAISIIPAYASTAHPSNSISFNQIKAKWSLVFNQVDLELGRKFYPYKCFALRPFAAVRGAWIKTRLQTTSLLSFPDTILTVEGNPVFFAALNRNFKDRFIDRYWGVGLVGGIEPSWYFGCNFSIFGNIDGALIYGKYQSKKHEIYKQNGIISEDTIFFNTTTVAVDASAFFEQHFYKLQSFIDLLLGLRWEKSWCCDRYFSSLDIGWEQHLLIHLNERLVTIAPGRVLTFTPTASNASLSRTPNVNTVTSYDTIRSDLMLGGLVVRLRLGF